MILAGQRRRIERSYTPHVTVAYGLALLEVTPIEPVAWQVGRLALVHSVVGQPDYRLLAD